MDEYYGGNGVMGAYAGVTNSWLYNTRAGGLHRLVTDGLVLALDAANTVSYPGSGTTWTDLSGSGIGTLTNGPTYNSANGGSLSFDGSNDFVDLSLFSITNNFSVELWFSPEATHEIDTESTSGFGGISGQKYIIGANFVSSPDAGSGISVGTNGISVYEHSDGYMPCLLSHAATITSFTQVTVVYTNKQPSLYLNGNFVKNGLTSSRTNVYLIGNRIGYGDYGYYQGKISSVRYYNRALTATEISQNFNALKSRFGL
jgi:hypothetical protein